MREIRGKQRGSLIFEIWFTHLTKLMLRQVCAVNGSQRSVLKELETILFFQISCLKTQSGDFFCFFVFAQQKWNHTARVTSAGHMPAGKSCSSPRHIMCTVFCFKLHFPSRLLSVRRHSGLKNSQVSRHCCVSVTGNIPEHIWFPFSAVPSTRYVTSEIPA